MSRHSRNNFGFTLAELAVSIAIVSIILTVVVSSQSTYTDLATLTNLADDIGLTISQAQAYGIGVKEFSPGTSEFTASYGLAFNLLASGSNIAYIYFADRGVPGDKIYNGDWTCPIGGASECLGKTNISRGNYIDSLCAVIAAAADICSVGRVDISFARPNTEAQLLLLDLGGAAYNPAGLIGTRIVLRSPSGSTRSVVVYKTGQISVQ